VAGKGDRCKIGCRTRVPSGCEPSLARVTGSEAASHRRPRRSRRLARLLSGIDLLVDFATLGEYGLVAEALPAEGPHRTRRSTPKSAWEALPVARARRGPAGCRDRRCAGRAAHAARRSVG
jgi:hypothetical protein